MLAVRQSLLATPKAIRKSILGAPKDLQMGDLVKDDDEKSPAEAKEALLTKWNSMVEDLTPPKTPLKSLKDGITWKRSSSRSSHKSMEQQYGELDDSETRAEKARLELYEKAKSKWAAKQNNQSNVGEVDKEAIRKKLEIPKKEEEETATKKEEETSTEESSKAETKSSKDAQRRRRRSGSRSKAGLVRPQRTSTGSKASGEEKRTTRSSKKTIARKASSDPDLAELESAEERKNRRRRLQKSDSSRNVSDKDRKRRGSDGNRITADTETDGKRRVRRTGSTNRTLSKDGESDGKRSIRRIGSNGSVLDESSKSAAGEDGKRRIRRVGSKGSTLVDGSSKSVDEKESERRRVRRSGSNRKLDGETCQSVDGESSDKRRVRRAGSNRKLNLDGEASKSVDGDAMDKRRVRRGLSNRNLNGDGETSKSVDGDTIDKRRVRRGLSNRNLSFDGDTPKGSDRNHSLQRGNSSRGLKKSPSRDKISRISTTSSISSKSSTRISSKSPTRTSDKSLGKALEQNLPSDAHFLQRMEDLSIDSNFTEAEAEAENGKDDHTRRTKRIPSVSSADKSHKAGLGRAASDHCLLKGGDSSDDEEEDILAPAPMTLKRKPTPTRIKALGGEPTSMDLRPKAASAGNLRSVATRAPSSRRNADWSEGPARARVQRTTSVNLKKSAEEDPGASSPGNPRSNLVRTNSSRRTPRDALARTRSKRSNSAEARLWEDNDDDKVEEKGLSAQRSSSSGNLRSNLARAGSSKRTPARTRSRRSNSAEPRLWEEDDEDEEDVNGMGNKRASSTGNMQSVLGSGKQAQGRTRRSNQRTGSSRNVNIVQAQLIQLERHRKEEEKLAAAEEAERLAALRAAENDSKNSFDTKNLFSLNHDAEDGPAFLNRKSAGRLRRPSGIMHLKNLITSTSQAAESLVNDTTALMVQGPAIIRQSLKSKMKPQGPNGDLEDSFAEFTVKVEPILPPPLSLGGQPSTLALSTSSNELDESEAEEEIRQLHAIGTQVSVLETMYDASLVARVLAAVDGDMESSRKEGAAGDSES